MPKPSAMAIAKLLDFARSLPDPNDRSSGGRGLYVGLPSGPSMVEIMAIAERDGFWRDWFDLGDYVGLSTEQACAKYDQGVANWRKSRHGGTHFKHGDRSCDAGVFVPGSFQIASDGLSATYTTRRAVKAEEPRAYTPAPIMPNHLQERAAAASEPVDPVAARYQSILSVQDFAKSRAELLVEATEMNARGAELSGGEFERLDALLWRFDQLRGE